MPKTKKKSETIHSPRIAHIDFYVEREKHFAKYVKYLSSPFHIMWRNFLAGAFRGLGFILGSAILLTLIGYITNKVLGSIPFFSDIMEAVNVWLDTIENR